MRERARTADIELTVDLPIDLPLVYADEIKIKQVLLNLLSNAVKFTARGGRVRITAHEADDGGIVFAVADTGIGMRRSEEHTSELQSLMRISYAVFGLKKKNDRTMNRMIDVSTEEHKTNMRKN